MILQHPSQLTHLPKRIVSLVPSQTELLYDLGLETETVGITKFCIHPQSWFRSKTRVGGTKTVNRTIIDQLDPDLIIANIEENVKEQVEALATDYPVWLTDVNNLTDALQMISDIGILTGKQDAAISLAASIKDSFFELEKLQTTNHKLSAVKSRRNSGLKTGYLIWKDPYMAAGNNTFINDMLQHCGLENAFADLYRYPEISVSELLTAGCQLLLLSSEPYPFQQKHIDELAAHLPNIKIMLVDGELFSWYGSRLLKSPDYFRELFSLIDGR